MTRRWSWDFEDEPRPKARSEPDPGSASTPPLPPPSPPPQPGRPPRRAVQVRRRRAAALIVGVLALVVVVVAAASGSHGGKPNARAQSRPHVRPQTAADTQKDQLAAVSSVLAYTPFVREGGSGAREVALTFDDGPGPYTPQLLTVLERYHVKATFFAIGRMLQYFSASTVREIEDGDAIGNHTETHPMLAHLSPHEQHEELFEQMARIELLGGRRPVLFRPPYGSFNQTTLRLLASLHLLMVLWSVDTGDYLQPGTGVIVERALAGARPGAIILMHDGGGVRTQTIEALPLIIKGLHERGYQIVTVPKLLQDDPPPAGQPLPPNLSGD